MKGKFSSRANPRPTLCLVLASSFLVLSCAGLTCAEDEPTIIVCTNSALADFAVGVLGDELGGSVEVEYIMPAGVCPSHFDTSPSDVVTISNADVVISLGWEPWLSDLLEASGNDDAHEIACLGLGEWNFPEGAEEHIDVIASGLSEFDSGWEEVVSSNAENYSLEIAAAYEAARLEVLSLGLDGTKVVTIEWYEVFLEGLGFEVVASYGPPEGLSTADILDITEACGDPDVALVVDNLQSTVDFGMELAFDYGKSHVVLSNFPGAIPGKYTYLANMEYNIDELISGAIAYESTQQEISDLESDVSSLEFQRLALISVIAVLAVLLIISMLVTRRKAR
jgi:ABC-type Zn uptake system ZnuABC Zn-binding protein ZnuA